MGCGSSARLPLCSGPLTPPASAFHSLAIRTCCRADFHYDVDPDMDSESPTASVPAESITITVTNPTQYGSGLTRHTRYCVVSQTSLAHFPRKGERPHWRPPPPHEAAAQPCAPCRV